MRIGKGKTEGRVGVGLTSKSKPARNQSMKTLAVIFIMAVTVGLITWVYVMGQKAVETVTVIKLSQNVYKNQMLTPSMLMPYEMLKGEFEKYARVDSNGVKHRRLYLWEEQNRVLNLYAAFPLKAETYLETRDLIGSRIDNSDSVLYSFPGKEVVPFNINSDEMNAFKLFLQPGDRLNIEGIYSQDEFIVEDDGMGGEVRTRVEVFRSEPVFEDIMIADLLNTRGESILDVYANYNDLTAKQQAQMDSSEEFRTRTTPKSLLIALTPEEKERYYYFMAKKNIIFKASMPQRIDG